MLEPPDHQRGDLTPLGQMPIVRQVDPVSAHSMTASIAVRAWVSRRDRRQRWPRLFRVAATRHGAGVWNVRRELIPVMKHMQRRLPTVLAVVAIFMLVSACGRVNLEDLTPEAIRTELAGRPTATVAPTREPAGEGTAEVTAGAGTGNLAAGASLYNAHCSGCHGTGGQPGRRATSLNGTALTFADSQWLRTGDGAPEGHGTYTAAQLSDNNLNDIFFYLQSQ